MTSLAFTDDVMRPLVVGVTSNGFECPRPGTFQTTHKYGGTMYNNAYHK